MICPNCGINNAEGVALCANCGCALQAVPGQQPAYQQQEYPQGYQQNGYQQNNYQHPYYQQNSYRPPLPEPGKGLAVASLVTGIVSLIIFALICGTLAIVFGSMAKKKGYFGGMATAGIVLGVIGLVSWVLMLIVCGGCAGMGMY